MAANKTTTCAVMLGLALAAPATDASARAWTHHRSHGFGAPPSVDAVELGALAPAARRSTVLQTYGDAGIARSHLQRRQREARASGAVAPYPCDPRQAGPSGYVCDNVPLGLGYGQYYAFTPDYVSAPQVVGHDPDDQSFLLPPITSLFWAVNSLRIDPH